MTTSTLDPVTFAILTGRLEQIADEMDATLYRSAFNPIIAEARDACHGLYHATTGATLVQGQRGLPIFVGAMAFAVKAVIDKVGPDGAEDGDTFIFNDPYAGGTHLNDFRLVRPLMRNGKLFAWLASVGHWLDIGGNVPGGYNPQAVESFQEGVLIPPVKLFKNGVIQQDIVDILQANTRVPRSNWGDLNGQLNALDLGEKRFQALIDEYGDGVVEAALEAASARAEALMRANIAALPDGTYSFEDYLDNDGIVDEKLTIALDLTIAGETMVLDFSRSSPACKGPVNIAKSTAVAACYVALKHIFTDVPAKDETALAAAVATQPVSVAIEADKSVFQLYKSGVLKSKQCGTTLDHGVGIVGYGTLSGTDYWKVKNSWGADWGDKGYIYLGRGAQFNGNKGQCGIQMAASYPVV